MRGNSLRFLKPSVFIKTFLVFCAIFAAMLSISCKQLASFEPSVDGARVVVSKTFSAPTDLTATQGRKQKISLEWTPVSGAKYYEIHSAKSATAEFEKIYETDKNSFDDKVGAGSTRYYKVCAVKSNGTKSAFSTIVKGTSLAQPVIVGGDVKDYSATISWFMENARGINEDNYEEFLKFEVFCEGGSDTLSQTFDAKEMSSYECEFDNLASSTEYTFYVVAYTTKDQQSTEQTPRVNKNTLTSYTPLAPTFNASEGTSAEGIWLNITLPEMVKVNTVTNSSQNEAVDEPYPLYFKVSRRIVDTGSYDEVCSLYYNGTEFTTDPVKYQEGGAPYKAGETGAWFDNDVNLRGGEKYEYKIISYSDTAGYDTVVCPEGTENNSTSTPDDDDNDKSSKAVGWKCALPSFKVNSPEKKYKAENGNNVEVLSYEFGFSAEWKDLGKAGEYKFAIKQNRKPLKASDSSAGDDTWLKNEKNESEFFDTLEEINSYYKVKFGSESGLTSDDEGLYIYTLYIVSKDVGEIGEALGVEGKELCHTGAIDKILVTKSVNLPKPGFTVEGGYTNKVVLTVSNLEPNVTYKVTRTKILNDGNPTNDIEEITLPVNEDDVVKKSYTYDDSRNMQDNCRYYYILKATDKNGGYSLSESREAETLGTPNVSFNREALSYDSVTISFDGVLAAKEYVVKLGEGGGFGGGAEFKITKGDKEWNYESVPGSSSGEATAKVEFAANNFTVTINKPEGYDNAKLAGKEANVTVTAKSDKCPNQDASAPSEDEKVKVLGPALLGAKVNTFAEAKEDSISVTWKAVEGAKGYLIRRVMYSDAAMTNVADGSGVTYYYEVASEKITTDGDGTLSGRIEFSKDGEKLTLVDKYKEKEPDSNAEYEEAQAKIAWGLPFRYVVLPVLNKKDFDFEDNSLKLDKAEVSYTNFAEKQTAATATFGYGLNLVADKATSGNQQNIKWNKPHVDNTAATRPIVYRRVAGESGVFTRFRDGIDEVFDENAKMDIKPTDEDTLYGAFEYLVKYYPKGASTDDKISPPDSLLDYIAKQTAEYNTPDINNKTMTEQDNKGYLLAIKDFSAEIDSENYYEKISWSPWNYKTRAVGPDKMIILIQNNNISAEAKEAVEIAEANSNKTIKYVGKDIDGQSLGDSSIRIKPKSISLNGTGAAATDGLLKVLRDYRHNYSYKLQRAGDEETITVSFEKSIVKTAYRQITDEELVRAATLAMSVGFQKSYDNRTGSDKWSAANTSQNTYYSPSGGSLYFRSYTTGIGTTWHELTYSSFTETLQTKSGNDATFLTIVGQVSGSPGTWNINSPSSYNGSITISSPNGFYSGTISFTDLKYTSSTGITVKQNGGSEKSFGNITPLPFKDNSNKFLNGNEEWQ